MNPEHSKSVAAYYDRHARKHLRLAESETAYHLHAPLWAPGISLYPTALKYPYELILQEAATMERPPEAVLDLGCGVGSALFYLAGKMDSLRRAYGVTISKGQADIAGHLAGRLQDRRLHIVVMDFLESGRYFRDIDLAFGIEAFSHAADAGLFFRQAALPLRQNGLLILIDYFLERGPSSGKEQNHAQRLRDYGLRHTLLSKDEIIHLAEASGFQLQENQDLRSWLRFPRLKSVSEAWMARWGGKMLQHSWKGREMLCRAAVAHGIQSQWLGYRLLTFKKSALSPME